MQNFTCPNFFNYELSTHCSVFSIVNAISILHQFQAKPLKTNLKLMMKTRVSSKTSHMQQPVSNKTSLVMIANRNG